MSEAIAYVMCLCALTLCLIINDGENDLVIESVVDTVLVTDMNYSACLQMIGARPKLIGVLP